VTLSARTYATLDTAQTSKSWHLRSCRTPDRGPGHVAISRKRIYFLKVTPRMSSGEAGLCVARLRECAATAGRHVRTDPAGTIKVRCARFLHCNIKRTRSPPGCPTWVPDLLPGRNAAKFFQPSLLDLLAVIQTRTQIPPSQPYHLPKHGANTTAAMSPSPRTAQRARERPRKSRSVQGDTSIKVFRKYLVSTSQGIDASQVLSQACYQEWLETRHGNIVNPPKSFQRALTAHLTRSVRIGNVRTDTAHNCRSDGRRSFAAQEEAAILPMIRQKKVWPAFERTLHRIGLMGFRAIGFHERSEGQHLCQVAPGSSSSTTTGESGLLPAKKRSKAEREPCKTDPGSDPRDGEEHRSMVPLETNFDAARMGDERPPSPLTASDLDELLFSSVPRDDFQLQAAGVI
jgi:hypothetical protein